MVLVILLYSGFSLPRSAIYCTLLAIFIGALSKETRIGPKKLLNCLIEGVKQASYVALPTSAAYLIGNVLFCSSIQGLGIEALPANMFIFYFGVIAQITPPVCMASYTAAGIAGASAWRTGWKAFTFAVTAFLVPFLFVYQPAIC